MNQEFSIVLIIEFVETDLKMKMLVIVLYCILLFAQYFYTQTVMYEYDCLIHDLSYIIILHICYTCYQLLY